MKKSEKMAVIYIVLVAAALVASCVIYGKLTTFRYEKHLDDEVISVDGREITLREFGVSIYDVESAIQQQALAYDSENPGLWWNTHFSAGADSAFMSDYAKEMAVNICICNEIYSKEAEKEGLSLSDEEKEQISEEADETYLKMSLAQRKATGVSRDIVYENRIKRAFAGKYAAFLAKNADLSGYNEEPTKLLNWDGDYYKDVIYPEHDIKENDKLLDNITFGKITVNNE